MSNIKNIKIRQGQGDYLTKKLGNAKGIVENCDVNEQKKIEADQNNSTNSRHIKNTGIRIRTFLFFIGNGGSPHVITEWILTSQAWADNKMEKRARQLDFIFNNRDNKSNIWFYYDLFHKGWGFLNGNKRTC